jgi:hypothetical protein
MAPYFNWIEHQSSDLIIASGIALLRKDANADEALKGLQARVKEMNDHILPPG